LFNLIVNYTISKNIKEFGFIWLGSR